MAYSQGRSDPTKPVPFPWKYIYIYNISLPVDRRQPTRREATYYVFLRVYIERILSFFFFFFPLESKGPSVGRLNLWLIPDERTNFERRVSRAIVVVYWKRQGRGMKGD